MRLGGVVYLVSVVIVSCFMLPLMRMRMGMGREPFAPASDRTVSLEGRAIPLHTDAAIWGSRAEAMKNTSTYEEPSAYFEARIQAAVRPTAWKDPGSYRKASPAYVPAPVLELLLHRAVHARMQLPAAYRVLDTHVRGVYVNRALDYVVDADVVVYRDGKHHGKVLRLVMHMTYATEPLEPTLVAGRVVGILPEDRLAMTGFLRAPQSSSAGSAS